MSFSEASVWDWSLSAYFSSSLASSPIRFFFLWKTFCCLTCGGRSRCLVFHQTSPRSFLWDVAGFNSSTWLFLCPMKRDVAPPSGMKGQLHLKGFWPTTLYLKLQTQSGGHIWVRIDFLQLPPTVCCIKKGLDNIKQLKKTYKYWNFFPPIFPLFDTIAINPRTHSSRASAADGTIKFQLRFSRWKDWRWMWSPEWIYKKALLAENLTQEDQSFRDELCSQI